MNSIIFDAVVIGQRLSIGATRLASGSCNVVQFRVGFDTDVNETDSPWEGFAKTAVFYRKEEEVYHVIMEKRLDEDGYEKWFATVPREVLADDGYFYFGLMGVNGEAILTSDVVRLTVYKGAITTPTNVPEEYTPNIYEQLLARVNQAVEMKGSANETIYPLEDEYIAEGSITVNGSSAAVSFLIDGLTLTAYGSHRTDGNILPAITPLFPKAVTNYGGEIKLHCVNTALDVVIKPPQNEGDWASISIINQSNATVNLYNVHCYGFYDLAAPFIPELADIRIGADGKTYDLAGEAVRAQIQDVLSRIQGGAAGRISHIDLPASAWVQSATSTDLYSQVVAIDGVTEYSKVDLNPSVQQLAIFHEKDISFVAENEDGVVTVYCIGQKPTASYQMQITVSEVLING